MTAIQSDEDVAQEVLDSITNDNLSEHQSEIERIAARIDDGDGDTPTVFGSFCDRDFTHRLSPVES